MPGYPSDLLQTVRSPKRANQAAVANDIIPIWSKYRDDQLLEMRICDLGISIENSPIAGAVAQLYRELEMRRIGFRPHVWLSSEWFSPENVPGIAVPFYLAHPRLARLERSQMLDVEGGTRSWCMKILRHETGHALDTAFRLHRRKRYRELFGSYSTPYPTEYCPDPSSRDYVLHLEPWYAQSHPCEDFAETFAVWLKPRSRWRSEYQGWKALQKLEYVDQLMKEISERRPAVSSRRKIEPAHRIRKTLREHYQQIRDHYGMDLPSRLDHELKRLFKTTAKTKRQAASFLLKNRAELTKLVSTWTGETRYLVNQVLREMIDRCRTLDLRVGDAPDLVKQNVLVMLTIQTVNLKHGEHHPVSL